MQDWFQIQEIRGDCKWWNRFTFKTFGKERIEEDHSRVSLEPSFLNKRQTNFQIQESLLRPEGKLVWELPNEDVQKPRGNRLGRWHYDKTHCHKVRIKARATKSWKTGPEIHWRAGLLRPILILSIEPLTQTIIETDDQFKSRKGEQEKGC